MKPLLSVIVPAYNAEKWIESCLRSILQVSVPYTEALEVIVVNDGSTDNTREVLEKLQFAGFQFQTIHQENRGLSGARNTGMHKAQGRYVAFVDADDEWCSNIPLPWKEMQEGDIEILGLDIIRRSISGKVSPYRRYPSNYGVQYAPALSFLKGRNLFPSACANLYAQTLIERENLWFTEGIYHEDEDFTTRAFLVAKSFMAVPGPHYLYIERSNSITTSRDVAKIKKRMTDLLFILKRLQSFSEPEQKKALDCKTCFLTTDAVRVLLDNTNDKNLIASTLIKLKELRLYPFPYYANLHYCLICIYLYFRMGLLSFRLSKKIDDL